MSEPTSIAVRVDGKDVQLAPPPGWEDYSRSQQFAWIDAQKRRVKAERLKLKHLKERIQLEKFDAPDIEWEAPTGDDVKFVIRANYGALSGTRYSHLVVLRHRDKYLQRRVPGGIDEIQKEDLVPTIGEYEAGAEEPETDVVRHFGDGLFLSSERVLGNLTIRSTTPGMSTTPEPIWGPREFVWRLLREIGRCGGQCIVYIPYLDVQIEVDLETYKKWGQRASEDPLTALIEPLKLLEGE